MRGHKHKSLKPPVKASYRHLLTDHCVETAVTTFKGHDKFVLMQKPF